MINLKSDFTIALEQCMKDCSDFVAEQKNVPEMKACVDLAQRLIRECADCLAACETARLDRGVMMFSCAEACKKCLNAFINKNPQNEANCLASVKKLIEELSYVMA